MHYTQTLALLASFQLISLGLSAGQEDVSSEHAINNDATIPEDNKINQVDIGNANIAEPLNDISQAKNILKKARIGLKETRKAKRQEKKDKKKQGRSSSLANVPQVSPPQPSQPMAENQSTNSDEVPQLSLPQELAGETPDDGKKTKKEIRQERREDAEQIRETIKDIKKADAKKIKEAEKAQKKPEKQEKKDNKKKGTASPLTNAPPASEPQPAAPATETGVTAGEAVANPVEKSKKELRHKTKADAKKIKEAEKAQKIAEKAQKKAEKAQKKAEEAQKKAEEAQKKTEKQENEENKNKAAATPPADAAPVSAPHPVAPAAEIPSLNPDQVPSAPAKAGETVTKPDEGEKTKKELRQEKKAEKQEKKENKKKGTTASPPAIAPPVSAPHPAAPATEMPTPNPDQAQSAPVNAGETITNPAEGEKSKKELKQEKKADAEKAQKKPEKQENKDNKKKGTASPLTNAPPASEPQPAAPATETGVTAGEAVANPVEKSKKELRHKTKAEARKKRGSEKAKRKAAKTQNETQRKKPQRTSSRKSLSGKNKSTPRNRMQGSVERNKGPSRNPPRCGRHKRSLGNSTHQKAKSSGSLKPKGNERMGSNSTNQSSPQNTSTQVRPSSPTDLASKVQKLQKQVADYTQKYKKK